MVWKLKRPVHGRLQAAAEALLPGMASENLGLLAQAVSRVAEAVLLRAGDAMTPDEEQELSHAVAVNAGRFLNHLSRRSTAELWESFAVPWDYRTTLARVQSGRYTVALLEDATWAVEQLVATFSTTPPRTAAEARRWAMAQVAGREPLRFSGRAA